MDKKLLDEIIACLPKDRTLFRYARNDYALMLLSRYVGKGMKLTDIRRSPFGRLLEKPAIRSLIAEMGSGRVSGDLFDYVYVKERQDFLLTIGRWNEERSRHNQTTRNNANLVLQVNFNCGHDQAFEKCVAEEDRWYFESCGHPIFQRGARRYFRYTLAWIRLDIDFDHDEVLIEEIQTDWLRDAKAFLSWLEHKAKRAGKQDKDAAVRARKAQEYVKKILAAYFPMWDEAALAAALKFIADELGIGTVYYHSFETGNVLKGMRYSQPPRSLYTDLPRKFCFELTDEVPRMFSKSTAAKRKLRRAPDPKWYRLSNLQNMEARP
ncbi:MAG: hypothetical protein GY814_02780 [Gammaproteobacteria bacterium]|nr:hypothetical protein [Gammaproteobacteria bacterium]